MLSSEEKDYLLEMKKTNSLLWMIFGALLVIAGTLIATLPYISSYTRGAVEIQSTKGGTYVLSTPIFLGFGGILIILGIFIMMYVFVKIVDDFLDFHYTARYHEGEYNSYREIDVMPKPQIKKKKVKTTPDGRPIHKKKKIKKGT